ncbi:MAG: hypothetical protein HYV07_03910 [Deltaproteobacteria bacterium]|nr:hypothetical protein [Deltaproteobacteria bacterium]
MLARGEVARKLLVRMTKLSDEGLAELSGVGDRRVVVILGPSACLPWVDGVEYLGRDPASPALLVPTATRPSLPMKAVESAITRRFVAPVAFAPGVLVSVAEARPIERSIVAALVEDPT